MKFHNRWFILILLVVMLGGYWLLPINGRVFVLTDPAAQYEDVWPRVWAEPAVVRPGDDTVTVYVRDNAPWAYVKLLVDGVEAPRDETYAPGAGPWTWRWRFTAPERSTYEVTFYHDCDGGCIERARHIIGPSNAIPVPEPNVSPTKLGVVFADPDREWHGRAAWSVELTYMQDQANRDFNIDGLASWVQRETRRGLRVLVRIAYDRQQALPPANNEVELARYLEYCARLVRDDRLNDVYAYIIGAGMNDRQENTQSPQNPITPEWYARVFNGYGLNLERDDNAVQTMRSIDPQVRVLVGAVTPWSDFQNGAIRDSLDQPWLNYMNTLTARIDETALAKMEAGTPFAAPDGFTLQAPGRPDAPQLQGRAAAEPATDIRREEWGGAQAGFRIYRDWLAIINRYESTRGAPAYIVSTNTWTVDTQTEPAQNYPAGWLTTALDEINREPQIHALCWFVDAPLGEMWSNFSLSRRAGKMYDAAEEFDTLLRRR
jgi:hypothetical protein